MSKSTTRLVERIALAVVVPGYIFIVLLFASLSWTMADERRRVEAGPTISAIVGPIYFIKGRTMGEVSYSIASSSGPIECRDAIELGPENFGFHQGQIIRIVAGDHCGQAVSTEKRLMPFIYGLLTVFAVLFPVANYAWRRRKQRMAKRSPAGSSRDLLRGDAKL